MLHKIYETALFKRTTTKNPKNEKKMLISTTL